MRAWIVGALLVFATRASADVPAFGLRAGVDGISMHYDGVFSDYPPRGAMPILELEGGMWLTENTSLTLSGVYGAFDDHEPSQTALGDYQFHVRVARLGMRYAYHDRDLHLILGFGWGATWSGVDIVNRDPVTTYTDTAHYIDAFVGFDLVHAGPVALELVGDLGYGAGAFKGATLGLAWDPRQTPRPERAAHEHIVGALRVGEALSEINYQDSQPRGWGHWFEGEIGWRATPYVAFVAFAAYTKFSGTLNDFYGAMTTTTFHQTRLGVRTQFWFQDRVFIAPGVGLMSGDDPGSFVDVELGVELYRYSHFALDATSQGSLSSLDYGTLESSFALGVAYR